MSSPTFSLFGQERGVSHHPTAEQGTNSQTTKLPMSPVAGSSSAPYFPHGHRCTEAHSLGAVGATNLPETSEPSQPIRAASPASNLLPSQSTPDSQRGPAGQDTNSQTPTGESISKRSASSAPYLPGASDASHTREVSPPASDSPVDGQPPAVPQQARALSGGRTPARDQVGRYPQTPDGAGSPTPTPDQRRDDNHGPIVRGGFLRDPVLGLLADVLDDLEKVRIANENRVRQLTRTEEDSDGEERGFGLTLDNPMVRKLVTSVEALAQAEKDATANLDRKSVV